MKSLTANFMHYFQLRKFWLAHLGLALTLLLLAKGLFFSPDPGKGLFFAYLPLSLFAGVAAAWVLSDTLSKPFVYLLPGHAAVPRRLLFLLGGALSATLASPFLAFPGLSVLESLSTYGAGTLAGLALFLCGAWLVLGRRLTVLWLVGAQVVLVIVQGLIFWLSRAYDLGPLKLLHSAIVLHPLVSIAACGAFSGLIWLNFSGRRLSAKIRRISLWNAPDFWLQTKPGSQAAHPRRGQLGAIEQLLERFFLSRMAGQAPLSSGRFEWGAIYTNIQLLAPMSRRGKFGFAAIVSAPFWMLLFGYVGDPAGSSSFSTVDIIFLWPFMLGMMVCLPMNSTLLLPAGRSERLKGVLAVSLGIGAAALVFCLALIMVSWALHGLLPDFAKGERVYAYTPVNPMMLFPTMIAVAAWFCSQLLVPHWDMLPKAVLIIALEFALFNSFQVGEAIPLPVFLCLTGLSWVALVALACYCCLEGNLIAKKPGNINQRTM